MFRSDPITSLRSGAAFRPSADAAQTDRDARWPSWLDGVDITQPETAEAAAQVLADAAEQDRVVVPVGAGMHLGEGRVPDRADIALVTGGLDRVLRYDPDDLVVSLEAGMTLGAIQSVLGEHNQWLPVDVPGGDGVTLGGALATALLGPRQLGSPSLRDLLLGMSVALPDGTVAHSGGMVVKNVTGFDMGRLHVGAFGTLGVICSANFKVLPRPETETTVLGAFEPDERGREAAFAAVAACRSAASRPVAVDFLLTGDACQVAARFEGRSAAVTRQAEALAALWPDAQTLPEDESADWWRRHVAGLVPRESDRTLMRIHARPRDVATVIERSVTRLESDAGTGWSISASPGLGTTRLSVAVGQGVARFADLTDSLEHARLVVESATADGSALNQPAEYREIDAALRRQFDPRETINRGRFPLAAE